MFAIDPDGHLKWRTYDVGGTAAPVIGVDGTIYVAIGDYEDAADSSSWPATSQKAKLLAIRPDGIPKWSVGTVLWLKRHPRSAPTERSIWVRRITRSGCRDGSMRSHPRDRSSGNMTPMTMSSFSHLR